MGVFTHLTHFEVHVCCNCHMEFAVTVAFDLDRLKDRKTFCCPNGHRQSYRGPTKEDRLRAENNDLKATRNNLQNRLDESRNEITDIVRSRDSYKGHYHREKKKKNI